MQFTVTSEAQGMLGLKMICQVFADGLWVPAHLTPEQASEFAREQFKRTLASEIEMLDIRCKLNDSGQ